MRLVLALAPLLFVLSLAAPALACPVCFDPRESNQSAFISMTIFMSLLPLGTFGGLVLWVRKRAREIEEAEKRV